MNQKILFIIIVVTILVVVVCFYFYVRDNGNKKAEIAEPQLAFSYVGHNNARSYATVADPPVGYRVQSQNWEGDKLKIVVSGIANLCAKKEGSYVVKGDEISLMIREEAETTCNGINLFDFTFLVGPLVKNDYKISFSQLPLK